jgi:hypothetical protein
MNDKLGDSRKEQVPAADRPVSATQQAREIDDELRLEQLIGEARPTPWPRPPRRRLLKHVFTRYRERDWQPTRRAPGFDWAGLRRFAGYAAVVLIGLALWTVFLGPPQQLVPGFDWRGDQVLVFRYEIQPDPATADTGSAGAAGMPAGLTPLDVIVLSEDELNTELNVLADEQDAAASANAAADGGGQPDERQPDPAEQTWRSMLSAFYDWVVRQHSGDAAPWAAIELQKVYAGGGAGSAPAAVEIEIRFSGQRARERERLAAELAALFENIPLVSECTVSESRQTRF